MGASIQPSTEPSVPHVRPKGYRTGRTIDPKYEDAEEKKYEDAFEYAEPAASKPGKQLALTDGTPGELPTLYTRYNLYVFVVLLLLIAGGATLFMIKRKKKKKR